MKALVLVVSVVAVLLGGLWLLQGLGLLTIQPILCELRAARGAVDLVGPFRCRRRGARAGRTSLRERGGMAATITRDAHVSFHAYLDAVVSHRRQD